MTNPAKKALGAVAMDGPGGAPRFELFVTSAKQLKWRPALSRLVEALSARFPGFSADDVLDAIAARGLDPDKPLRVEGAYVTLQTVKVDSGVPEPATFGLSGVTLLGALLYLRRKRT